MTDRQKGIFEEDDEEEKAECQFCFIKKFKSTMLFLNGNYYCKTPCYSKAMMNNLESNHTPKNNE